MAKPVRSDFQLIIDKQALKKIFGGVDRAADRHRMSERLSKINRLARPLEVFLNRHHSKVSVSAPSAEKIQALAALVREKGGRIQDALADWLQANSTRGVYHESPFNKVREAQLAHLRARISRDWGAFSGVDPDALIVDVVPDGAARPVEQVVALLQDSARRGILVTGEVGSGKTTLLYRLLKDFPRSASRLAGLTPLYMPATRLFFKWGEGTVPWTAIPGIEPQMLETVQTAFAEGKLLLLLDGLNENPGCVDFTNPGVQHFWERVFRNWTVIATVPEHFESCLKLSPIETFSRLRRLSLPQWQLKDYQAQFAKLIQAAGRGSDPFLVPRLKQFPVARWMEQAILLRRTPLVGCAAANFVAHSPDVRMPRNEFELMEHMVMCHLDHSVFKGNVSQRDTLLGVLMKIAVRAYHEGQSGARWCVPMQTALEIARGHLGANVDVRVALGNLPFLEFSQDSDVLFIDQHVGDFLVARFLLNALLARDYSRFREILECGIRYDRVGKYYFQGFESPSRELNLRLLRNTEEFFNHLWEIYEKKRDFGLSLVLGQLLQPLGHLAGPEARQFLWEAFHRTQGTNFVFLSATIALARGGEDKAEEAFIQWLAKAPGRRDFILQWRLFYERNDKDRRDFESFAPAEVPGWDDACDWLLRVLTEGNKHFYPLRHLYLFTLLEFIHTKGAGPFHPPPYSNGAGLHKALERRRMLGQAITGLQADRSLHGRTLFQAHLKALLAVAAGLIDRKTGGNDEQESKIKKGKAIPAARKTASAAA